MWPAVWTRRVGIPSAMVRAVARSVVAALTMVLASGPVFAQAGPFGDGAAEFQASFLTILTPIAVIAVMALGAAAWFNRISWGWAATGVAGIVMVFGAPQLVGWVRDMFGV